MARGRMIDNCISISEDVNDLTLKEAFIYTWIIPHLDDWGRITGSPRKIKALVFPMKKEITIRDIENALTKFKQVGLFLWEKVDDTLVLQQPFEDFNDHQHISEGKRANSKYPEILEVSPESPGIPRNPPESPPEFKRSKEKISKDKDKRNFAEFVTLTLTEYRKLKSKYGKADTKRMIEKLDNWKGAKGKTKEQGSDYRKILNWVVDAVIGKDPGKDQSDIKDRAYKCYKSFNSGYCTTNEDTGDAMCRYCRINLKNKH